MQESHLLPTSCYVTLLLFHLLRSLFEKDKLLFAFLLTARIMLGQNELDGNLYQFLLTGEKRQLSIS